MLGNLFIKFLIAMANILALLSVITISAIIFTECNVKPNKKKYSKIMAGLTSVVKWIFISTIILGAFYTIIYFFM